MPSPFRSNPCFYYAIPYPSTLIVPATSQIRCMINTIRCIYSKLPPDDECLISSKYADDGY
jgi:hypothetical protein